MPTKLSKLSTLALSVCVRERERESLEKKKESLYVDNSFTARILNIQCQLYKLSLETVFLTNMKTEHIEYRL